ncbi:MAG: hypothetical protein KKH11_02265, partial [Candidatus Omnitrophica bacterium]|nr:hypothetical protein [Candidatus Omnitrophota bacterium]
SFSICVSVVRKYLNFSPWDNKPWEIRFFCRLLFITNETEYTELFEGNKYPMNGDFPLKKRIIIALPLIALLLIILGVTLTVFAKSRMLAISIISILLMYILFVFFPKKVRFPMFVFFRKLMNILFGQVKKLKKAISSIILNVIATVLIIIFIAWICRLSGYDINIWRSFKENIIDKLVVVDMPPKANLFTQFPYEYGYERKLEFRIIQDGETLSIKEPITPLWIGIWNDEARSLSNASLIIRYFSDDIKGVNGDDWKYAWLTSNRPKEYQYIYPRNINRESGLPVHPPIQFEFTKPNKKYKFVYMFLCDGYKRLEGSFFVDYREEKK